MGFGRRGWEVDCASAEGEMDEKFQPGGAIGVGDQCPSGLLKEAPYGTQGVLLWCQVGVSVELRQVHVQVGALFRQ